MADKIKAAFEALKKSGINASLRFVWLALAVGLIGLGQVNFFSRNLAAGMGLTLLGAVVLLLAAGESGKQAALLQRAGKWFGRAAERFSAFARARQKAEDLATGTAGQPAAKTNWKPLKTQFEETRRSWLAFAEETTFTAPKNLVMILGILLILAGQPFLVAEKFVLALILVIPGLYLLVNVIFAPQERYIIGRLDHIIRTVLFLIPGVGLIILGCMIHFQAVSLSLPREALGLGLNALGIFIIFSLFPKIIPDPFPESGDPVDQVTGRAANRTQVFLKIGLVTLALVFFLASKHYANPATLNLSALMALLFLTALSLSFPWSAEPRDQTSGENIVLKWLVKYLRLAAFGLGLYWAYRGQVLISHEQLYPGLYRFLAAAIAMWIALREPDPKYVDELKEKPLAWYWEALALVAILSAATWVRVHLLKDIPYGIECDEAGAGAHAVDVLQNHFSSLTIHPSGRPLFMLLDKVVTIRFFGIDNIGMKLGAAIWGTAGVFCVYLMTRFLFGTRAALATAALMACSRWHIHFSRYGWANTLMLVLQITGFYFIAKGIQTRNKWFFFLAGVGLTLSIHTETAARMVPFMCLGLLVYFVLFYKRFFRRNWQTLLVFLLGVWLAGASLFLFWVKQPRYLFNRVYEVSVFSGDANAPRNLVKGLVESTKLSLTQMNWHGDTRTRHNGGLSGEPVLDFWSAILFALGFGFSLYYWRRFRYTILLMWFFGSMAASIFALEAPQSHRAFGALPPIFMLMGAFIDRSRRLLRETLGKPGTLAGGLVLLLLLVPIAKINYKKYFDAYPGFDTACTAAAKYMGRVWPKAEQVIMSAYLWIGHPPFELYARGISGHFYFAASEAVPFRQQTDRDVNYTLILEYPEIMPTIQWYYPEGEYSEETHVRYGLQYRGWGVKHEIIQKYHGLNASYWSNPYWAGEPKLRRKDADLNLTFDQTTWPWNGPGSVKWEGTVFIPREGKYVFYLYGTNEVEVKVGSQVHLRAGNKQEQTYETYMAGGLHRLDARAVHSAPGERILFAWSCSQDVPYYLYDEAHQNRFAKEPVPNTHLFTYPEPKGLLATFYYKPDWTGGIARQVVEPALFYLWMGPPYGLNMPFSADWKGWIDIEKPGTYQFGVDCSGYADVTIDGIPVVVQGEPPFSGVPRLQGRNSVQLAAGRHPVTVRWSQQYGLLFRFWWVPPGQKKEIVPVWVLTPQDK